jgi:hypothetical protein
MPYGGGASTFPWTRLSNNPLGSEADGGANSSPDAFGTNNSGLVTIPPPAIKMSLRDCAFNNGPRRLLYEEWEYCTSSSIWGPSNGDRRGRFCRDVNATAEKERIATTLAM